MRNFLKMIVLAIIAVSFFSCSRDKTVKYATIYPDAKSFYVAEYGPGTYDGYFLVPADTNHDGANDIRIRISFYNSGTRLWFLKQVAPGKEILVKEATYDPRKGTWYVSGEIVVKQ